MEAGSREGTALDEHILSLHLVPGGSHTPKLQLLPWERAEALSELQGVGEEDK